MLLLIDSLFFLWRFMIKLSWLEAGTLMQSFSFFLKLCSSEAIFPTPTIFIPVERSPSMDYITSDRAGFMTRSRVSFILQAGWSTEKDGFVYRASRRGTVSPILESAETWWRTTSPAKPFSGVSESGPVSHLAESPYFGVDTYYWVYIYTPFLSPTAHLQTPVVLSC